MQLNPVKMVFLVGKMKTTTKIFRNFWKNFWKNAGQEIFYQNVLKIFF